jgi:hypothetical protein
MARKAKKKVPTEILFTTDAPVNITVKHNGRHWYIAKVVVEDTDVDLDPKHVRAYDPVNDVDLTRKIDEPEHPAPVRLALAAAFKEMEEGSWPEWQFGE